MDKKITESKLVYAEFKEFKNIYTSVNSASEVLFIGADDGIDLVFSRDDSAYIFYGHWFVNSELANWLKEDKKMVAMKMETFKELSQTLKKNVISIEMNDLHFKISYNIKDSDESKDLYLFNCKGSSSLETILDSITKKKALLKYHTNGDISWFQDELLRLFLKDNAITQERTADKLIEIPVARLISLLKNPEITISYSDKVSGQRYVEIKSKDPDLGLELSQLFLTI